MGIKQLSKLIKENTKKGIVERPLSFYSDKRVCIDASMFIYQFLIAVRADGMSLGTEDNTTSHLVGLFYRTIRLVETGITPVYVFDGTPPEMKLGELRKRVEKREKAEDDFKRAEASGDKSLMEKYEKRRVKVGKEHVDDCKRLLSLMGIPFLDAPSEAEAYCAFLCLKNYADCVATEDMDALTFGAPCVLRNFTASHTKKVPVLEYTLPLILKELGINMEEFVDLCILLGCDYCNTLKGVGVKRALLLLKKYKSIEKVLEEEKVEAPEGFNFEDARTIFKELPFLEPKEEKDIKIKWEEINLEEIKKFLVEEKQFDESRVVNGINKLKASQRRPKQMKLDKFFLKK